MKITEKVSINVASEASYIYFLSGQQFIKNAQKMVNLAIFFKLKFAVKQCYQTGIF